MEKVGALWLYGRRGSAFGGILSQCAGGDLPRGLRLYLHRGKGIAPWVSGRYSRHGDLAGGGTGYTGCEFIPDAWEAILQAEQAGFLVLRRYGEASEKERQWLYMTVREEYRQAEDHPEYRHFLRTKFDIDPDTL